MQTMRIGIIGLGMVGEAVAYGLAKLGHHVVGHDIAKPSAPFTDLLDTELCFICVPTPMATDANCDTSIVKDVVGALGLHGYKGLAVIKSTVPPGTTAKLQSVRSMRLAFCPEFLRERARFSDFFENHEVCIAGVSRPEDAELIRQAHGSLPKHFAVMSPTEAELAKYFANTFNALRVVFANAFADVCHAHGADYARVKNAVTKRASLTPHYLECNEAMQAFGGACLPKDSAAFAAEVRSLKLSTKLFDVICSENERVKRRWETIVSLRQERVA